MASASASGSIATGNMVTRVVAGIAGGLVGGLMFGLLMQMMGMIGMVAMLVGSTSAAVGWLVHLAVSAFIGATYALLFSTIAKTLTASAVLGMGYGVVWWVVGGLLLMPVRLGMPPFMFNAAAWQSLMGHAVYGLLLGLVYALILPRLQKQG